MRISLWPNLPYRLAWITFLQGERDLLFWGVYLHFGASNLQPELHKWEYFFWTHLTSFLLFICFIAHLFFFEIFRPQLRVLILKFIHVKNPFVCFHRVTKIIHLRVVTLFVILRNLFRKTVQNSLKRVFVRSSEWRASTPLTFWDPTIDREPDEFFRAAFFNKGKDVELFPNFSMP